MKRFFLITFSLLLFVSCVSFAQQIKQSDIPSIIINQFQKEFPKAYNVDWEKKSSFYEVEFKITNGFEVEAHYDNSGKKIYLKQEITKKQLPSAVSKTLNQKFKNYRVSDVKKIDKEGKISYKLEMKSIIKEYDLILDEAGNILSEKED